MRPCKWEYCNAIIGKGYIRCSEHRNMKWWKKYIEHMKHLCWEEEEISLDDFESAVDTIHDCRNAGGPKEAALTLEKDHGINPQIFSETFEDRPDIHSIESF